MGTFVTGVASDLASGLLAFYVREQMLSQTTQDKPLVQLLQGKAETFPGGTGAISVPVQTAFMSDTAGFFAGYSEDDALTFGTASNMLRASYNWKEHHAGLVITWSELKKDGFTITEGNKQKEHNKTELVRLTSVLKNRLDDFGESWSRSLDHLFWMDGSQDAKAMPGLTSLLLDDPSVTAVGGLSPATYPSWKNRASVGTLTASGENSNIMRFLSQEEIQLKRYGGKPDIRLMGSDFRNAVEIELRAKGLYTQHGYEGKHELGIGDIVFNGQILKYAPWLDDHGRSKYCYFIDSRRLKLRPMEGEQNRIVSPERPYNYAVFLRSMMTTLALVVTQRNCHGVYSIQ